MAASISSMLDELKAIQNSDDHLEYLSKRSRLQRGSAELITLADSLIAYGNELKDSAKFMMKFATEALTRDVIIKAEDVNKRMNKEFSKRLTDITERVSRPVKRRRDEDQKDSKSWLDAFSVDATASALYTLPCRAKSEMAQFISDCNRTMFLEPELRVHDQGKDNYVSDKTRLFGSLWHYDVNDTIKAVVIEEPGNDEASRCDRLLFLRYDTASEEYSVLARFNAKIKCIQDSILSSADLMLDLCKDRTAWEEWS